jgi:hypothetical protein
MKLTLDIDGLAEAMCISPETVKQYVSREPGKLPPRVNTGMRKPIWYIETVKQWLAERSVEEV